MENMFNKASYIIKQLNNHGYEAYFVGGSVRDYYLGRSITDIDITTNAKSDAIESIFKHTIDVGKAHGTIIVVLNDENYEVTTYRLETTYSDYRRPDSVQFSNSLFEDVKRRDFTMNAIAMTPNFDYIDFFNGRNDIKNKCIRSVGDAHERFNEDALRMLRATRFMAQLNFSIDENTTSAIKTHHQLIDYIAVERIKKELEKLFSYNHIYHVKKTMIETNLKRVIPFLKYINDELFLNINTNSLLSLIAIHSYLNESLFSEIKHLKLSKREEKHIKSLIQLLNDKRASVNELAYFYSSSVINDALFLINHNDDLNLRKKLFSDALQAKDKLPIHERSDIKVNGKDLMAYFDRKGGTWLKEYLNQIEKKVLNLEVKNNKNEILEWVSNYDKTK